MTSETRICQNCKGNFLIEPEDFNFYEKMKVPPPTWCPECRLIRRMMWRNERVLYKRRCDLCEEEKILVYSKNSPFKVFCFECFFSDKWSALDYYIEYDFSKTFFEQWKSLLNKVPRLGIIKQGFSKDSEYTNRVTNLKNCYLIFGSADNENCYYGKDFWDSKDSVDCYNIQKCERCYECIDCYNSNNLKYSQECESCIDSYFLRDCRNCQNCFGCVNLRNKNYCIFNEQYTREQYLLEISKFDLRNRNNLDKIIEKVEKNLLNYIFPSLIEQHSTNVSGNWIESSKNVKNSFNCNKVEEGKYLFSIVGAKDVMDYTYWGRSSELIYESCSIGIQCSSVLFSNECWRQLNNSEFCYDCFASSNLFGCIGLEKKQYCILNKQYTKEGYFKAVEEIKKHMDDMPYVDKRGLIYKYGEFFPIEFSPFAYNETIAFDYFKKTKEEAVNFGLNWKEPEEKNYVPTMQSNNVPEDIKLVDENILKQIIACAHNGKCNQYCTTAFRITKNEFSFYKANDIPLPILCPNCRHYER